MRSRLASIASDLRRPDVSLLSPSTTLLLLTCRRTLFLWRNHTALLFVREERLQRDEELRLSDWLEHEEPMRRNFRTDHSHRDDGKRRLRKEGRSCCDKNEEALTTTSGEAESSTLASITKQSKGGGAVFSTARLSLFPFRFLNTGSLSTRESQKAFPHTRHSCCSTLGGGSHRFRQRAVRKRNVSPTLEDRQERTSTACVLRTKELLSDLRKRRSILLTGSMTAIRYGAEATRCSSSVENFFARQCNEKTDPCKTHRKLSKRVYFAVHFSACVPFLLVTPT